MFNYIKLINTIFIFFIIFIKNANNYIIFPFKLTNSKLNITYDDSSNFVNKFLSELDKNRIYTKIIIGEPKKEVAMFLTMEDSYFRILKNFCPKEVISSYNPYFSKTFKINDEYSFSVSDLLDTKIANDTFSFYKDSKLKDKLEINFDFLIANETLNDPDNYIPDSYCGKIGLLKKPFYPYAYINFIDYAKKIKKIFDSYQWGIFFFDKEKSYNIDEEIQEKYDGFYIIGLTDNDYLNLFKTKEVLSVYQLISKTSSIGGQLDEIYFYSSKDTIIYLNELEFEINIDHNFIVCMKDYFDNIKTHYFNKYIDNNICQERNSLLLNRDIIYLIVCNLTIKEDLDNFPSLYLNSRQLNFTFTFNYKDLFFELNNRIYFLVIYRDSINTVWNFGSLLIKKYPFMFDQDKNTLHFIKLKKYQNNPIGQNENIDNSTTPNDKNIQKEKNKKSFWSQYKEYILFGCLFIFLIIGVIFGYIFGRKIWEKRRKTRANELDDNFDYTKEDSDDKFSEIIN